MIEEEDRFAFMLELFNKLGEVEYTRRQIKKAENGDYSPASSLYSQRTKDTLGKAPVEKYQTPQSDFLHFDPVTKFVSGPVKNHYYPRGSTLDYCELSYKLIKSEAKLVRSTLEAYGFNYTDSHDWNLLWLCVPGKPYLYEGLNEH